MAAGGAAHPTDPQIIPIITTEPVAVNAVPSGVLGTWRDGADAPTDDGEASEPTSGRFPCPPPPQHLAGNFPRKIHTNY